MTANEAAILEKLSAPSEAPLVLSIKQLGGSKGSGHTTVVSRMEAKGWLERVRRGGGDHRPAYGAKITPQGRQALANHQLTLPYIKAKAAAAQLDAMRRFGP